MNDHRATARAMKAAAIADTLYDLARRGNTIMTGVTSTRPLVITPELIDEMPPALREQITLTAQVKPASSATWRVVRRLVERRGPCWPHVYTGEGGRCLYCDRDPKDGLTRLSRGASVHHDVDDGRTDR